MKRSIPYIGIARMHDNNVPQEVISSVVDVAFKAAAEGLSDEEILRLVNAEKQRLGVFLYQPCEIK
jgi:uncharacterized protein (DUF1778 family)